MITCQCGKQLPTMCAGCTLRSFVVESAKRRPGLLARLDLHGEAGYVAHHKATNATLNWHEQIGLLRYVQWGTRGAIDTRAIEDVDEPTPRLPFLIEDEDWFILEGASWEPVFVMIEEGYRAAILKIEARVNRLAAAQAAAS